MNLIFKRNKADDCHSYIYISGHRCDNPIECQDEFHQLYQQKDIAGNRAYHRKLLFYLNFAVFLTAKLKKYVIVGNSPVAEFQDLFPTRNFVKWRYEMLSDDNLGMGADHGFVSTAPNDSAIVAPIESVRQITCLPEDLFADTSTNVTVFGLANGRIDDLIETLNGDNEPNVDKFLQGNEIFIHLMCGKEYGHFNGILIKSKHDLEEEIAAAQSVLDAGN